MIKRQIQDSIDVKKMIMEDKEFIQRIAQAADFITKTYCDHGKLLLCGNGGSAADAQHIAGEMVAKFRVERRALPAIAFNTNSSVVTAIGNDYEYNRIFERQVEALGREGDTLLAISTSGNSASVVNALRYAKRENMKTVALLGGDGGVCREYADIELIVPSKDTPRIQEAHIMIGHIICDLVEQELFGGMK